MGIYSANVALRRRIVCETSRLLYFFFCKILCHWINGVFQCSYNKIRHIAPLRANRSPTCCCRGYRQHSHVNVWEFASFVLSSPYHYYSPRAVWLLELWVIPQPSYLLTPADFLELYKKGSEEKEGGGDEYVSYVKHLRLWSHNSLEKCINKHSISHLASFVAPSTPHPQPRRSAASAVSHVLAGSIEIVFNSTADTVCGTFMRRPNGKE